MSEIQDDHERQADRLMATRATPSAPRSWACWACPVCRANLGGLFHADADGAMVAARGLGWVFAMRGGTLTAYDGPNCFRSHREQCERGHLTLPEILSAPEPAAAEAPKADRFGVLDGPDRRTIIARCGYSACRSTTELMQSRHVDHRTGAESWSPDVAATLHKFGWITVDGRRFCGGACGALSVRHVLPGAPAAIAKLPAGYFGRATAPTPVEAAFAGRGVPAEPLRSDATPRTPKRGK